MYLFISHNRNLNDFSLVLDDLYRQIHTMLGPALVVQLDVCPTDDQYVAGSPSPGQQHSFVEIDHENFQWSFSPFG